MVVMAVVVELKHNTLLTTHSEKIEFVGSVSLTGCGSRFHVLIQRFNFVFKTFYDYSSC